MFEKDPSFFPLPACKFCFINSAKFVPVTFFLADSLDMMVHLGDTILIEAYNVDHGLDAALCISDSAIECPQYDWLPTFNTPKSVKEWSLLHFNEKVHVVGTLQFEHILFGPVFSFVDIQLVDE